MSDDIGRFLEEDIGSGDITSELFVPDTPGTGRITVQDDAVLAGLEEAAEVFSRFDVKAEPLRHDGEHVSKNDIVMELSGSLRGITTAERTALNIMMRMTGIATMTARAMDTVRENGGRAVISGTRKTTPGFRKFEKKAIAMGGGEPHRMGLYDMVLIKDNHIKASGGVDAAMAKLKGLPDGMKVEIEVENAEDAAAAARWHPDMIMLDNRTPGQALALQRVIRDFDPDVTIEVSGRIDMDNLRDYALCGDRISMGCLTHSVKAVHFSLNLD